MLGPGTDRDPNKVYRVSMIMDFFPHLRSVLLMRSDTCCRYSLAYRTTGSVSFRSKGAREDDR